LRHRCPLREEFPHPTDRGLSAVKLAAEIAEEIDAAFGHADLLGYFGGEIKRVDILGGGGRHHAKKGHRNLGRGMAISFL
jgi:hypothetical protein